MRTLIDSLKPTREILYGHAVQVGEALGREYAYSFRGAYHFRLADGWTIAISSEDAGRIRVDACRWTHPVTTLWSLADDPQRVVALVLDLADEIEGVCSGV
jgi:hypothetical protein